MRVARDFSSYRPVQLKPEIHRCDTCGQELKLAYNGRRFVAGIDEQLKIGYEVWRCGRPSCADVFPPFLRRRVLPGYEYGLDVIAFIGHRRLGEHQTFGAIRERLREDHRLQISEREVEYLFTQYIALVSTPLEKDSARLDRLRQQGRIVVSLDAAKPEADRDSLWIVRDVISGEILDGFSCLSIDAEGLARVLRKIKALGIPITGVVSDGQNIIVDAVAKALPGVPHQLCQFHFLKDLAKPVTGLDRDLTNDLKKQLRGLNAFEKAIDPHRPHGPQNPEIKAPKSVTVGAQVPSRPAPGRPRVHAALGRPETIEEESIVGQVCEIVRAILQKSGRYPLESPGVDIHELIRQTAQTLHDALKKSAPCSLSNSPSTSVMP